MGKKSIIYSHPRIYKLMLRMAHGTRTLDERYSHIANKIGANASVLEVGCGPALLPPYLEDGCTYSGFDTNPAFVHHGQRNGLDVVVGNALDPSAYHPADAVVLCDLLHHLSPEHQPQLLTLSRDAAQKKLIICDPFKDEYLASLPRWLPFRHEILNAAYNLGEKDGQNQVRLENISLREELREKMMRGFGVIPTDQLELFESGEDLIVTYHL